MSSEAFRQLAERSLPDGIDQLKCEKKEDNDESEK